MLKPRSGILVVDDDDCVRQVVIEAIAPLAKEAVPFGSGDDLLAHLKDHLPELILLDLMMPGLSGLEVLREVRSQEQFASVPIVVLTGITTEEVALAFAAGADDYVTKPFQHNELLARVRRQLHAGERLAELAQREQDLEGVVELVQRMAQPEDIRSVLAQVVARVAALWPADRVSVVLARDDAQDAFVVVSSDDPLLQDLPIQLSDYPELQHCLQSLTPIFIADTRRCALLSAISPRAQLPFQSTAVAPITHAETALGALFVRSSKPRAQAWARLPLLSTIGHAAGAAIANARLFRSLKQESRESIAARLQAERRMRLFQPYAEFFKNSAEGMVVIDSVGRILFANPRAREIAGESALLEGANVAEFILDDELPKAHRLAQSFKDGVFPTAVDLRIRTAGAERILNVNSSATLRSEGGVLLTFRDVTQERETERELTQTKVFLERLIDSSVDAIVSANLEGRVLVFNRAASRIFGYEPSDVVGEMSVERLYPPHVAREVMKRIRGPEHGGPDRLEDYQVDMLDRFGRTVPVSISASLIYEDGKPVGSVGIFTDIREQLRMEAHLREAQNELKEQEKSMAVAQLAGATAHELNQPLTSVIAYAELLQRKVAEDSKLRDTAQVIVEEAERMANIVRQIGRITKYETKTYVGQAQILDLQKATGEP
ncbi:MAG: Family ership [Pseudomonadota bacterium]|jgi:PAS domain S-box-containing protein